MGKGVKIYDKWNNVVDIETASIQKLKAMMMWMEGMVFREMKEETRIDVLQKYLPDEYWIIENELRERGREDPYKPFAFFDSDGYKKWYSA